MTEEKEEKNKSEEREVSALGRKEVEENLKQLKNWELSDDEKRISRTFNFESFQEAINFVNNAAAFAKKVKHYPVVINIQIKKVTVELTTPEAGGLTEEDFVLAAEIDAIAGWKRQLEKWFTSTKVIVFLAILLLLVLLWQYSG